MLWIIKISKLWCTKLPSSPDRMSKGPDLSTTCQAPSMSSGPKTRTKNRKNQKWSQNLDVWKYTLFSDLTSDFKRVYSFALWCWICVMITVWRMRTFSRVATRPDKSAFGAHLLWGKWKLKFFMSPPVYMLPTIFPHVFWHHPFPLWWNTFRIATLLI